MLLRSEPVLPGEGVVITHGSGSRQFPVPSADVWNERLRSANGHLLQSWEWGDFKLKHGWSPARILVESGDGFAMAQVLYRYRFGLSVGYIPRGPVFDGDPHRLWPLLRDEID